MRCITRLVIVGCALVVALIIHVLFVVDTDDGTDRPGRQVHRTTGEELVKSARDDVLNDSSRLRYSNERHDPEAGREHEKEAIDGDYEPPFGNQSGNEEDYTDELHKLYQELRSNPRSVAKEVMMAQKIMYVRIPECGSRAMINPMATVAKKNVPSLTLTMVPENVTKMRGEGYTFNEKLVFEHLYQYPVPYLSAGGHWYVNFRRYGDYQPIAFTVFGDPVERFINMFYYVRKVNRAKRKANATNTSYKLGPEAVKTSLEKCVTMLDENSQDQKLSRLMQRKRCGFELSSLARVMCGEDKRCSQRDAANFTLQEALRNLDDFLVVGFTDELENTARAMERLLPFYLKGFEEEFREQFQDKTGEKKTHPKEVADKLRRLMKIDYVLYDQARERFNQLKKDLGI